MLSWLAYLWMLLMGESEVQETSNLCYRKDDRAMRAL